MKKIYLAPQTEAIKMLGDNAIMAGSPPAGLIPPHVTWGGEGYNGTGQ